MELNWLAGQKRNSEGGYPVRVRDRARRVLGRVFWCRWINGHLKACREAQGLKALEWWFDKRE